MNNNRFSRTGKMARIFSIMAIAFLCAAGCSQFGPKTLTRDRFDYNEAISRSWKEQTLLNIVKLRYADMPPFVEVASVVSGYTLEGSVNLGGTVSSDKAVQGDFFSMGTAGKYTDRPTITYAPITGSKFNESFMTPIPPRAILFLIQSGWPADIVLHICLDSINGLRSRVAAGANQRAGDSDFYRLIELIRETQKTGAVGMRIIKEKDQEETTVLFFYRDRISPETEKTMEEINRILGLNPERSETKVIYGLLPGSDQEIAMLTRSTLQIMLNLATQIDVPEAHLAGGLTLPSTVRTEVDGQNIARLIHIHSGAEKPEGAFAAVRYENHWFWIDNGDFNSKRTFGFLMILFSLTETGGKEGLPLVTIPAG
jgi:hypothetical protein